MHTLLKSQIARCTGMDGAMDVDALCDLVERTYAQFDVERMRSERATRLMIAEVEEADAQRQAVLESLKQEHLKLDIALEHMAHGLAMFDDHGRLIVANQDYCRTIDAKDRKDRSFAGDLARLREKITQTDQPLDEIPQLMSEGIATERIMQFKDGRIMLNTFQPLEQGGWVQVLRDVTRQQRSEEQIRYLAEHDVLTGLANRVVFNTAIEQALSQCKPSACVSVLCIDLDHFKSVNDTLGHPVGDALLCQVAMRLKTAVGESGTIARLGGDEFAVLMPDIEEPGLAETMAKKIIANVSAPYSIEDHHVVIGASIGLALAPCDGDCSETLMRNADIALYRAKSGGRGVAQRFEQGMDEAILARRQMELDLRQAIMCEEFELFYQPLMNLRSQTIESCEALIRWNHPIRGLVPPNDFIPLAEETGLIVEIGEWTMLQACSEATTWPEHIGVAINVSPAQFMSRNFLKVVRQCLRETGLAPARMELEITESVLISDTERTLSILHALRDLGVKIAMDDFGTGYSSLSYLRRFPFDKLKIDRCFINDLAHNPEAGAIVRTIIQLANTLGMSTTAEGVEEAIQKDILTALNCKQIQGYLISRPVPRERLPAMISPPAEHAAVA